MSKSLTINTPSGRITPISFKDFIKLIPVEKFQWTSDTLIYYRLPRDRIYLGSTSGLTKIAAPMLNHNFKPIPEDILQHQKIIKVSKEPLIDMVYDITTESQYEMGSPTHVVRLSKRLWMASNPNNFKIYLAPKGWFFASIHPNKNIAWKVLKNS